MFVQKSFPQLGNLVIGDAKGLLQHNLPDSDVTIAARVIGIEANDVSDNTILRPRKLMM